MLREDGKIYKLNHEKFSFYLKQSKMDEMAASFTRSTLHAECGRILYLS